MADIFISYKKEDAGRVIRLVEGLRAEGFTVWWDHGIRAGTEWDRTIRDELDVARIVIAIWSQASIDAPWVKEEANVGKSRGKLVPIKIDNVDPPLGFTLIQAADLVGWRGDRDDPRWGHFLDAVRATLLGKPLAARDAPLRQSSAGATNKLAIAAVGVMLLIAMTAVTAWVLLRDRPVAVAPPAPPSTVAAPAPSPPAAPTQAAAPPPASGAEPSTTMQPAPPAPATPSIASAPPNVPAVTPPTPSAPPKIEISPGEQKLWDQALKEKRRPGFQSYLLAYPSGAYAQRARDILLTCRTETHEEWKPGPAIANQMVRGVGDTSSGMSPAQACERAKADVRSRAKLMCETIVTNAGYRNPRWTVADRDCDCKKTSPVVTVCIADLAYSCLWEQKMTERVEICG